MSIGFTWFVSSVTGIITGDNTSTAVLHLRTAERDGITFLTNEHRPGDAYINATGVDYYWMAIGV